MGMVNVPAIAPHAGAQSVTSPISAVSSDRAGMETFFAARGIRYIQADIYEDGRARVDARRAAHQFDVFRKTILNCPDMRETERGEELLEACLTVQPTIAKRGVIDDLAICFINDLIGYGCFVQRDLAEGEHVGLYTGVISEASYVNASSTYIMSTNPWYGMIPPNALMGIIDAPGPWPKMAVDAERAGNELRFANHIEEGALLMGTSLSAANIDVQSYFHYRQRTDGIRGLFHVTLVAARDIKAGEELRYNYGPDYWEKQGVAPANSSVYRFENDRLLETPVTI